MPQYFFIQSVLSGNLVLDIKEANPTPGTPVIAWPRKNSDTDNQLWTITDDGFIQSKLNGFVLDLRGTPPTPSGTEVNVWPPQDKGTEQWTLASGGFIENRLTSGLVLDIKGGAPTPGAQIIVWPKKSSNAQNQQWIFTW